MSDTPLTDAVRRYCQSVRGRLHVPAHGGGSGNAALRALWPALLPWDVTEQPDLDDLSAPDGPIDCAQRSAARFFGAAKAFFLTNGVTQGLQAAVFASIRPGQKLMLARDSHRSLLGAMLAANADGVLIAPRTDPVFGVSLGPDPAVVEQALRQHPQIGAVVVTYPSYLGVAPDLRAISDIAHRHGVWVIADAAHGAHFGWHGRLPPPALAQGADIVVLGMHKSGGSLTQTAILALSERARALGPDIAAGLRLFGSSSPSYPLMISLEQAVAQAHAAPAGLLDKAVEQAHSVQSPARIVVDAPQDPLRIALCLPDASQVRTLADALFARGVRSEFGDGKTLLLVVPFGEPPDLDPVRRLVERVQPGRALADTPWPLIVCVGAPAAVRARQEAVPLREAAGAVAADLVASTPPGIPWLWPGETITSTMIDRLRSICSDGQRIMGLEEGKIRVVLA